MDNQKLPGFLKLCLILGYLFLYVPIISLIVYSFNDSKLVTVWGGFSVKWYGELLEDDELLSRKPLKTRQQITAIASREAEWARQTDRNLATARAWLAQARERLAAATGASVERRDTP